MLAAFPAYIAGAFIFGFILGRTPDGKDDVHPVRGPRVLLVAAALGLLTLSVASGARYWSGVGASMILMVATALVLSVGIGLLLGSLSIRLTAPGRTRWIAGILAFTCPLAALGWTTISIAASERAAERAKAERIAAFQMTTIEGTFAGHPIRLPVSPQIDAFYSCKNRMTGRPSTCRSHFAFHDGLRQQVSDQTLIQELTFWGKGAACDDRCLDAEVQANWCDRRPDFADTVFCDAASSTQLVFGTEPSLADWHFGFDQWVPRDMGASQIRLFCIPGAPDRPCQALFEPAQGIYATAWLPQAPDRVLVEQAREMEDYAFEIWKALSTPITR